MCESANVIMTVLDLLMSKELLSQKFLFICTYKAHFWTIFDTCLGRCLTYFRRILETFLAYFWNTFDRFSAHFGNIFGYIFGTCLTHFFNISGTFFGQVWDLFLRRSIFKEPIFKEWSVLLRSLFKEWSLLISKKKYGKQKVHEK